MIGQSEGLRHEFLALPQSLSRALGQPVERRRGDALHREPGAEPPEPRFPKLRELLGANGLEWDERYVWVLIALAVLQTAAS